MEYLFIYNIFINFIFNYNFYLVFIFINTSKISTFIIINLFLLSIKEVIIKLISYINASCIIVL